MKSLGIIRKIDDLGRVVIPKEVRRTQGWDEGQPMEIFMDGDKLVMQAYGKEFEKQSVISQLQTAISLSSNDAAKHILGQAIEFRKKG
ncbi:AbrB family transcriptional regulator [Pseudomonas syringae pv. syringae]|nr:AbrB family transcriptional regulator [Pseudomonas syringae pv. syringae]